MSKTGWSTDALRYASGHRCPHCGDHHRRVLWWPIFECLGCHRAYRLETWYVTDNTAMPDTADTIVGERP